MSDLPDPKPLSEVLLTVSEDARKSVEAMIEGARHFFGQDEEIPPAVTCVSEDSIPQVFPIHHHNDVEKQCMWAFVRFLRETHPVVLLISEIWASKCDKNQDPHKQVRPSQDPNRTEMVMINLWDRDRTLWIKADITRNPSKLGEFAAHFDTNDEDCHVEGELTKGEPYQGKEGYGKR